MATLDNVVERVRVASGADFAFVLTRKGRLVTHNAPREMPEVGRARLVRAARPLIGSDEVEMVTLSRQDLVPFGGAAPIDVYVAVAAEQAILCVVMASWADKVRVVPAIRDAVRVMEPILHYRPRRTVAPPAPAAAIPDAVKPPAQPVTTASRKPQRAPIKQPSRSMPDITVGEATLGRETLAAIDGGALGKPSFSLPEITMGEATLGRESLAAIDGDVARRGSAPQIVIGIKALGRETLAAIDLEAARRISAPAIAIGVTALGRESLEAVEIESRSPAKVPEVVRAQRSTNEGVKVRAVVAEPDPTRATKPWVESPEDAKRAADAACFGRKLTPPRLTIKLEELEEELVEATRKAELEAKRDARPRK